MRSLIFTVCLSIFLTLGSAIAQEKAPLKPSPTTTAPAKPNVMDMKAPSSHEEVAALREQNKIIKEYQESLLDTVYFALTGIFAMAALLAGFNWWTNAKVYEVDKARLREETNTKISGMESRVSVKLEESRTEFLRLVESRVDANVTKFIADFAELKTHLDSVKSEIDKSISAVRSDLGNVATTVKSTRKRLSWTTAELRQVEEYVWDLKGVPVNILITQSQGLSAAVEAENKSQVENVLERMKTTINEKILPKKVPISRDTIDRLLKRLDSASEYNAVAVSQIVEIVKKITIDNSPE